ncbi:NAD(P)/FAD-dependent oxidoreductase [Natronorubrum aibiense]|uniref:FAD-dependent oxidoreductase n=1 Tax=Natronorubrum aibiense TaxID=348826 RepID=A0A5P9P8T4_9EURY|nr:FAD-dependent oxidoreductase [Natronorubrum aibiense]QFU84545.1 FAD-dependent oxidoreductase [Natronorubrum aibiense]
MSERIAIVGGGVIGCAVARKLASDYEVEVFEKGQLASEASALAAGEVTMLSSYEDKPDIGWHAVDFFREYDGTDEFTFTELPSIGLVTPDREDEKRRYAARLAAEGLPVRYLDRETAREQYPTFDFSDHAGVIEHRVSGFVDPYTFAMTLHHDARDDGATFHTNTAVRNLLVEDDDVVGLETEDGRIDADHVVCAAGWRSREFLLEHVPIPVRPYRTQCIVLEPKSPLPEGFPMGWFPGEHVYFRPEHNGDFLIGGWSFAEDNPEGASGQADEAFRNHVADLVPTFLEGFEEAGYVDDWAGVDGATPDTRPILDAPADAPDGLIVATGFNGRGVMTAPVAATAVRSLITGEDAPFSLDTFAIDRFTTRSDDFEFISISAGD